MKSCSMLALVGLGITTVSAHASSYVSTVTAITDFTNGTQVSTNGTLIDAANLFNANVATTINGVLFKATTPGFFHEGGEDTANASFTYHTGDPYSDSGLWSSGGAYDTLADSQIYGTDNGNPNGEGIGILNLVPNQVYELQVFMLDDRSGVNKSFDVWFNEAQFTGFADQISLYNATQLGGNVPGAGNFHVEALGGAPGALATGYIATVTFSIDAPYNGVFMNGFGDAAFNGVQLRAVPEPASLALLATGATLMVVRRRRN